MIKIKIIIIIFTFYNISFTSGQCIERKINLSHLKIRKTINLKELDSLHEGNNKTIHYTKYHKDGSIQWNGDLKILRQNGDFIYKQIGEWTTYSQGKILAISQFDSCGYMHNEDLYQYLDSIKTVEYSASPFVYKNKNYDLITEKYNYHDNIVGVNSYLKIRNKRIKHGLEQKVINGKIISEINYEFGRKLK